jgi:D-aminopeptidase
MKLKKLFLASMVILSMVTLLAAKEYPANSGTILMDPEPDKDGKIKILLYYDMEGISGQNDVNALDFKDKGYEAARELLTKDVNAVVDGLFAGGADEVHIVDGHGSGNPDPDILLDKLDKRAKMIFKEESFRPYVDLVEKDLYDAVAVVCMHSKTCGERNKAKKEIFWRRMMDCSRL